MIHAPAASKKILGTNGAMVRNENGPHRSRALKNMELAKGIEPPTG